MPFSLPKYARTVFHVSLHNQVRGHAIFEVVLTNRQPPASHNFIHHPREMTPTILSRTILPQLLDHVQISTEYHLPVHGLPSVLRRVPLGNGSSRSHSLYHHQSQPEHFPPLRTGGPIGPHVRTPYTKYYCFGTTTFIQNDYSAIALSTLVNSPTGTLYED